VVTGRATLGAVPTQTTIIAEPFFDESGGHATRDPRSIRGRINKAWGLALRKRSAARLISNCSCCHRQRLNISLSEQHSFPLAECLSFPTIQISARSVLEQAVLDVASFQTRWAGMRDVHWLCFASVEGKKFRQNIQRMRADDLLAAVFPEQQACPKISRPRY